jgi:tetratricopeptide (TPR) repeat protein/GAF domain-containing protein
MADPSKLIDRGERLLEKGKPEQALTEFRAAIELRPDDERLLQRTADLALSIGKLGLATEMLRRLFAMSVESKQLGNSALVFRKLQRMKALDPEVVYRYAELCESTHRKDAADAFRIAFQEFQRLGDPRRALDCISQAVRLDPRLEDYREQGRIAEALHERVLAAAALVNTGVQLERMAQDASETYARAYANDPSNPAARLGHGRALIAKQRYDEAIELLAPIASYPSSPEEAREPYANALLAVGRVEEAEPFVWGIFERNPGPNLAVVHSVIGGLLDRECVERALGLARRLEDFFRKAGRRGEFMFDMAQLSARSKPSIRFLEYLAELYNSANREVEYSQILARLFDLYFEAGNYSKALDALDRAVDLDSYEAAHKERMQRLTGRVPEERLQRVAKRLGVEAPKPVTVTVPEESSPENPGPRQVEDLILQAEIFLQYGMKDKALEKVELLRQYLSDPALCEGVHSDGRVRQLFANAGVALPAGLEEAEPGERSSASDEMARAAEVSRLIARQSDPRQVLVTAVNQIGARWQYSRCLAALATPGKPPSLVVEYCSPEVAKSERTAMVRLLAFSQRLTAANPAFRAADVLLSEPLSPIRAELARLKIKSLVALALLEEDKPLGLLVVQQCGARRRWSSDDVALLRSLADQIALAIHGARLRSLVSTLGVAEEETGLLKRSSYLDAVVAELGRQRSEDEFARSLALLQVASLASETRTEAAVTELVRTLRSMAQDQAMPFRYDRDTVALLLPYMGVAEAEELIGRLREALEPIAVTLTAGIAQVGPLQGIDPEDAATEWVNRVARALSTATAHPDRCCTLPPVPAPIA